MSLILRFTSQIKHDNGFSHCSNINFLFPAARWNIGWDSSVKDTSNYTNNFSISFTSWKWGNEHFQNFISVRGLFVLEITHPLTSEKHTIEHILLFLFCAWTIVLEIIHHSQICFSYWEMWTSVSANCYQVFGNESLISIDFLFMNWLLYLGFLVGWELNQNF